MATRRARRKAKILFFVVPVVFIVVKKLPPFAVPAASPWSKRFLAPWLKEPGVFPVSEPSALPSAGH
jgi:hypothetical protein